MVVTMVATWVTVAKSSDQWKNNWPMPMPNSDSRTMRKPCSRSGVIRSRVWGRARATSSKPAEPTR